MFSIPSARLTAPGAAAEEIERRHLTKAVLGGAAKFVCARRRGVWQDDAFVPGRPGR